MTTLKRIVSAFLSLFIVTISLISEIVLSVGAASYEFFTYTVTNGTVTITDVDEEITGDIIIPSTLENCPIVSIGYAAFEDCVSITNIVISDGRTSIGSYAFRGCSSLINITIGNTVTNIASRAFQDCVSLETVTLSNSITGIKDYTFNNCISLKSVVIPDNVVKIGRSAFENCVSLETFTLPDSLISIDAYAFAECTKLTKVEIPTAVKSIGTGAFSNCNNLVNISIPNSVLNVEYGAFYNCDKLNHVFYLGSEEEWGNISYDSSNDDLISSTIHYNTEYAFEFVEVEPTCVSNGYSCYRCSKCNYTYDRIVTAKAFGHTFGEWTVTAEPNCTESGTKIRKCRDCERIETSKLAAHFDSNIAGFGTAFDNRGAPFDDNFLVSNISDGDIATSWQLSERVNENEIVQWDKGVQVGILLEQPYLVSEASILIESLTRYEASVDGMVLEYSTDNVNWYEVPNAIYTYDLPSSTIGYVYDNVKFDEVEIIALRMVIYKGTHKYSPKIAEIEIYSPSRVTGHSIVDGVCELCGYEEDDTFETYEDTMTASGIIAGVTAGELTVEVKDKDGNALADDALIGTGCTITKDGKQYTVIVSGDSSGDGLVNSIDFMQVRRQYLGRFSMNTAQALAADVTGDDNINSTDFTRIRRHFLGLYNLYN